MININKYVSIKILSASLYYLPVSRYGRLNGSIYNEFEAFVIEGSRDGDILDDGEEGMGRKGDEEFFVFALDEYFFEGGVGPV